MASNSSTIADDAGGFDDWIEVYNAGTTDVDLAGYYLSDDPDAPTRHRIVGGAGAETTVPARGYLLLWADGEVSEGARHLDFRLSASGESVVLTAPDGITGVDQYTFGPQLEDVSFGRVGDAGATWDFFASPTPGSANVTAPGMPQAAVPSATPRGGLHAEAQSVTLTAPQAGGTIRYTLDGSEPTAASRARPFFQRLCRHRLPAR